MKVSSIVEVDSTLTDRYQTTIPEMVRKALYLNKRDKIHYIVKKNGEVIISRAENKEDPVIGEFLSFLAKDMQQNPKQIKSLNNDLYQRIKTLVSGVEFDMDKPLADEDE